MNRWEGIKNVVVVGLGITGLSVVRHLLSLDHSLTIKVIDTRDHPPGIDELPAHIERHTASWNLEWLLGVDLVVVNPGIALATAEIQQVLNSNIPVIGDIELFSWAVNAPVIGITGSNGKSTVTDLTGVLASAYGKRVAVGGNIGVPALDLLKEQAELYVLELSSFQLETTYSLSLLGAAFLNLSEDHMDRYDGMESYRRAKLRIFDHAENLIVNQDDKATHPDYCREGQNLITFGLHSGQFSLISINGKEWLSDGKNALIASDELSLVGAHNVMNVLTVLALLSCTDIDSTQTLDALKSYTGLTHRCQVVAHNSGVKWVNDSKATNVASTLAALSGLTIQGTLHLLVGGMGKGADFSELAPALAKLQVRLYCFGQDGDQFMSLHPSATRWDNMAEILQSLQPSLKSGDMVMLSPACASFDQFKNFMARGDEFTRLANIYA